MVDISVLMNDIDFLSGTKHHFIPRHRASVELIEAIRELGEYRNNSDCYYCVSCDLMIHRVDIAGEFDDPRCPGCADKLHTYLLGIQERHRLLVEELRQKIVLLESTFKKVLNLDIVDSSDDTDSGKRKG